MTTNEYYACGECCKELGLLEKIKISWHTGNLILNDRCKFLDDDNSCKIYSDRARLCKLYLCDNLK